MLKQILDYINSLMSSSWRLARAEEDIKAIKARADKQEDGQHLIKETLIKALSEIEKDRAVAGRDQQLLIIQIKDLLKDNEQRALPPGSIPQNAPDLQAQIDALKQEVEELKSQFAEWKAR